MAPVPGMPCWVNLMVGDIHVTRAFYAAVLGWTFEPSTLGNGFLTASADGRPVAGIGMSRPGLAPAPEWTPYFAVSDADATTARVQERGATVAVGPVPLGRGRACLAADRDGAAFGYWQGPAPCWALGGDALVRLDLRSPNAFDAAVFYGEVFGWSESGNISVTYENDRIRVRHGEHSALCLRDGGTHAAPDPRLRSRWLVTFAVDDVERAMVTALSAGGSRPRPPAEPWTPQGFSRTLLDPDGALFTLVHRGP
ncbi:VOC family protein [Streptomyces sp. NPDC059783]|uniref:VOC family protein n=1 Tax=Streptomyces sp. NPDC059783 TaxID=3346944 RepID=UPI003659A1EC